MAIDEMLRTGDLAGALREQTAVVRSRPTDQAARIELVYLLVLNGELDRAEAQLLTVAQQDAALQMATAMYRSLLAAEEERGRAYAGSGTPNLAPEAAECMADRIAALAAVHGRRFGDAEVLLERARAAETALPGQIDRIPFTALADYDDLLGPTLEVFAGGRYFWVPFARLQRVTTEAPRSRLDLLWLPATIFERGGVEARVHVPVHYAGTSTHGDAQVRAGRQTEWTDLDGIGFRGFGPRLLIADGSRDIPLLDVRTLEFAESAP